MKTLGDLIESLSYELDRIKDCANAPRETQTKLVDEGAVYASLAKQLLNAHDMAIRSYTLLDKGIIDKSYINKYIEKTDDES